MKILYVAELVGKAGLYCFRTSIDQAKRATGADFVIACADGATGGNGLGRQHAAFLRKLGADVLTTGDCCFYKKDLTADFGKMPYVLRPENLSQEAPGLGARVYRAGDKKVAVAVLLGQSFFNRLHADNPWARLPQLLDRFEAETPNIVVDFHSASTAEKRTLFEIARGRASAVIGSHSRVQTADAEVLDGGTAVITDAGRTGSIDSVGGCKIQTRIGEYISGIPEWTSDAWDKLELQGVLITLDDNGKAHSIERIRIPVPPASPSSPASS
ncbi:MAG: YmdB family metallophosphoesterase [Spirochaetaceae bacterium]|jgi:metallophosphoesterase (TIGR00282 family)|nr:YmdB family metallophosphoesterase [Spirochaetaceae bacterium]